MEADEPTTVFEGSSPTKRGRGRPKGSRNKPHLQREPLAGPPILMPPSSEVKADYKADPDTLISRQLALLDWAQQATRNEMQRAMQSKGLHVSIDDIERLEKLSNAIVRSIDAMKKSSQLADELSARLTPEQLLEAALKKLEGQDLATVAYAIRRLQAHRDRMKGRVVGDREIVAPPNATSASGIVASLDDGEGDDE